MKSEPKNKGITMENTTAKTVQEQVYDAIQSRIFRICFSEWAAAKKNKRGRLVRPLTYSPEVDRLISLSGAVLGYTPEEAEETMAEITTGEIQHKFLTAKMEGV